MVLSLKGIRVEDKSILPNFMTTYYTDINFKGDLLSLDASRKNFRKDEKFTQIKNELELLFLKNLESIIDSFSSEDIKTKLSYVRRIFRNYFWAGHLLTRTDQLSPNLAEFFKTYYLFPCITHGKFTYATPRELIRVECIVIEIYYEPQEYLSDIAKQSAAFDFEKNYVFVSGLHFNTDKAEPRHANIVTSTFGGEIKLLSDIIQFSELDEFKDLDILADYWALVNFHNYESKKIVDLFTSTKVMLNYNHPFVKLLIKHKSLIMADEELNIRVKLFFKSFGYHNYHYKLDELTYSQKKVLDRLVTKGSIVEAEANKYLITESDLPVGETEWHFGL